MPSQILVIFMFIMDYTNHLVASMNNISLEDEEKGGLALEIEGTLDNALDLSTFDAKLCVVAPFISEVHMDF